MVKNFQLYSEFNKINGLPFFKTGDLAMLLSQAVKEIGDGLIEVVVSEKNFKQIGSFVVEEIKKQTPTVNALLVDGEHFTASSFKSLIDKNAKAVIVIGGCDLLSYIRYYSSLLKIDCYAIPTTPLLENLINPKVILKTKNLPATVDAVQFKCVIIDEAVILKGDRSEFAEAYLSTMGKLTSLIDYKINSFLTNEKINAELFNLVKQAINKSASLSLYENHKSVIIYSQLLLALVNNKSTILNGSGFEVVDTALSLFAPNLSGGERKWIAFQKTAKIYHMYFSNDFSELLSVANYEEDLELLEQVTNKNRAYFSKNLKIPSERRRNLINILMHKTSKDFKSETSLILSLLFGIKKTYQKLESAFVKKQTASYKQIKNAITVSPYLSQKIGVLTLCRDMGILKCAN